MTRSETLAETVHITASLPRPRGEDRRRIGRRLAATVAAAATALGLLVGTSIPARADNDDLAKALAALAIVGIIASQANRNRGQQQYQYAPQEPKHGHQPRPARHPRVPSVCAIEISGQSGTAIVYGENCLRQQGFDYRLPQYCARSARIYGQRDRIYSDQCLREAGFRVEGARY
ncbi:hypothetical protein [Fuscovulum ytuae]|uniref:Uncharacterized protein n=1 Tax=Fuscovulum ytuae TaxID=3042299 RepID=A0ABY8Q329_9RHOB|nr:hypothetical protein [Fuscovulum sp. YMD61]WGV15211.1 hypothetical protein QF092_13110 [Fuscovulum sp. YMD61]